MFRRQTDEVFSTLQQVQRRLSQHTETGNPQTVITGSVRRVGGQTEPAARPATQPPRAVTATPSTTSKRRGTESYTATPPTKYQSPSFRMNRGGEDRPSHVVPVVDRSAIGRTAPELPVEHEPEDVVQSPMPRQGQRRVAGPGLMVGVEMGLLLAVLWVGSVIGAYALGAAGGSPSVVGPGAEPAPGPAGGRSIADIEAQANQGGSASGSTPAVQAQGNYVLVLESYARFSQQGLERFENQAAKFNQAARENAQHGYRPYFGVRRPSSGGLQFVFGAVAPGVFGIDKEAEIGQRMYTEMRKQRFPDAFWIKIRD